MTEGAASRELGRLWRVQLRRAAPADAVTGRILRVVRRGEGAVWEIGA